MDIDNGSPGLARQRVAALAATVEAAARACHDTAVRKPARTALRYARTALRESQAELAKATSNWDDIARDADARCALAVDALRLAERDRELAQSARASIASTAALVISILAPGSQESKPACALAAAGKQLRQAATALSQRHYEEALHLAHEACLAAEQLSSAIIDAGD